MKIIRWRGIFALLFFTVLLATWWILFGERTVRSTLEEAATSTLGTQVDIARLDINLFRSSLVLNGIAIANPFDSSRNLVEANDARIELELDPLLRRKIVVRNFAVHDVQTGTTRARPARRVDTAGFAPRALREIQRFRDQINVPLLSLTPLDTIKSLVLDPSRLRSVQAAVALQARADSLRSTFTTRADGLLSTDVVDSADALLQRLRGQTVRTLGVAGVLRAIADLRRLTARVDSLKRGAESLHRDVRSGFDSIVSATRAVDDARRADYAFARSLLALPTFDAPSIGPALFGDVSVSTFERTAYWVALAREHAPPGLLPREKPGPARVRRSGTSVQFAAAQAYPTFLLRDGEITVSLGQETGAARGLYSLKVSNFTTEPAIVGRPATFSLSRQSQTSDAQDVQVSGSLDHTTSRLHDVVNIRAGGIRLPVFPIPAVPLTLDMGRGQSTLALEMLGDSISAQWSVTSSSPLWLADSSRMRALNTIEGLVTRVLAGIRAIRVDAELTGTLASPRMSVSSTLDREIAASIRSVAGAELEKAEQRVRAQVDSIAEEKLAPVRARVAEVRGEIEERVNDITDRIDALREQLLSQLRALGG